MNLKPFPRVCAHRGLSGLCPENTLPAFAAAIALGADEIELDVWASRDGELVVCHDDDVSRTSNGRGKICEMSWEELCKLDGGSWFNSIGFGDNSDGYIRELGQNGLKTNWAGALLCRLDEVFEQFGGKVGMKLHLKEAGKDGFVVRKTAEMARKFGITRDV
jgi:glycerophosphoryl diester phosphodiesterase